MKRLKLWAVAATLIMTASCEKPVITDDETSEEAETTTTTTTKKFTFTLKGDFSDQWKPVTRGYLQADGKDLTDVWVLDYMDGKLVQQVHQTDNTAEDFGKPVMSLKYGSHHIYFIASRGQGAQLDTDAKTITFSKVLDTFYKDYEVSVAGSSNGNRAVTMDSCVTLLHVTINDVIPDNMATLSVTPKTWYYGWNYLLGCPAAETADRTRAVTVPESKHGATGLSATFYGMSASEEWNTDVVIKALDGDDNPLGQTTITAAPFMANRQTELSGMLLTRETPVTLSVNADWLESYEDRF
jgi:hypothetical protein